MRKIIYSVLIAVVLIAGTIVFAGQFSGIPGDKKEVKIGAILTLTGDYSIFGTAFQRGIELAIDELNSNGDITYKIIFEDDENLNIKKAVEASHKLISADRITVGMVTAVNEGKAIMPIFEEAKVPLIVLFDTNKEIANGDYPFSLGFSTEGAAKSIAEYAFNKLGVRKVAIVYSFDEWSALISKSFKEEFESLDGEVILFEGTDPEEKDFRTVIIKSARAEAIYAPLLLPSNLIRQARELGYGGYLLSADSLNPDQIEASSGSAEGVYFTDVYVPDSIMIKELIEKHVKKYVKEPEILALTAIGYDSVFAIDAAARLEGVTSEDIKNGLYKIQFEGATGTVDFDETGLSPRFERVFVVENNRGKLVE